MDNPSVDRSLTKDRWQFPVSDVETQLYPVLHHSQAYSPPIKISYEKYDLTIIYHASTTVQ
ncbi:hypothetical protein JCM17380_35500 [Desulfosporosinus burensis]